MAHYYYVTTDGPDTNLQLYSLRQAHRYWSRLTADVAEGSYVEDFQERCVFVVCTIGLSISQLLGQNNPAPTARVPPPSEIFESLVQKHNLDAALLPRFTEFIHAYDHCRHFGITDDHRRHHDVDRITLDRTKALYEFGLLVWKLVIEAYKHDTSNELDELDLDALEDEA